MGAFQGAASRLHSLHGAIACHVPRTENNKQTHSIQHTAHITQHTSHSTQHTVRTCVFDISFAHGRGCVHTSFFASFICPRCHVIYKPGAVGPQGKGNEKGRAGRRRKKRADWCMSDTHSRGKDKADRDRGLSSDDESFQVFPSPSSPLVVVSATLRTGASSRQLPVLRWLER